MMSKSIRIAILTAMLFMLAAPLSGAAAGAVTDTASSPVTPHQATDTEGRLIDAQLSDGGVYWQGQRLGLGNLSAVAENEPNISSIDALHLRRYNADKNKLGPLVREIEVEGGQQTLGTGGLDGTYVLVPADQRTEALQFTDGSVTGTAAVSTAEPFEVLVQTLSVWWDESPSAAVGSARELDIRSNRLRYNVKVSSPELSYTELETAFMGNQALRNHNGPFGNRRPFDRANPRYSVHKDNGTVVLRGFKDGELRPDFSSVDQLPGTLRFEVTDTGVTDRALFSTGEEYPFNIIELGVTKEVKPGQSVTLRPKIKNEWRDTATETITFELGDARSTFETTISGRESKQITTTLPAPTEPGNVAYKISTEGESVSGTIIVLNTSNTETEKTEQAGGKTSVFGFELPNTNLQIEPSQMGGIMTILSLLTVVLFRRR